MTSRTALVVGATGIVGLNLATHLAVNGLEGVRPCT